MVQWQKLMSSGWSTDYESASHYYSQLKNKMINEMVLSAKIDKKIANASNDLRQHFEHMLSQNVNNQQSRNAAEQLVQNVDEAVVQVLESNNKSLMNKTLRDITSRIKRTGGFKESYINRIRNKLKKDAGLIMSDPAFGGHKAMRQLLGSINGSTVTEIKSQLISYYLIKLYTVINNWKTNPEIASYINSLSGYFVEESELQELQKAFSKIIPSMNVTPLGGENLEIDILISNINNVKEAFNQQYQGAYSILLQSPNIQTDLLNAINVYGEQVKSWTFDKGGFAQKSIGSRHELRAGLDPQEQSSLVGMYYLSKYRNILFALGPQNVLFRTGSNRYWTCDFIKTFRKQNYLLSFARGKGILSNSVVLEQIRDESIAAKII